MFMGKRMTNIIENKNIYFIRHTKGTLSSKLTSRKVRVTL